MEQCVAHEPASRLTALKFLCSARRYMFEVISSFCISFLLFIVFDVARDLTWVMNGALMRSHEKMHRLSSPAFHIHSQRQTQSTVTLTTCGLVEWNYLVLTSHRALDDWQNAKFPNAVERDTHSNWTFIIILCWHAAVFYCFVAARHVCVRNVPLTQNVVFLSGIGNVAAIGIGSLCNAIDPHGEHLHMNLPASWP